MPVKKRSKKAVEILAANFALVDDGDDVILDVSEADDAPHTKIWMSRVGADRLSGNLAAHLDKPLAGGASEWACSVADAWVVFAYPEGKKRPKELISTLPPQLVVSLDFLASTTASNPLRKVLRK